jgi:hypothetical protein
MTMTEGAMQTKLIEFTHTGDAGNWAKVLVAAFSDEWAHRSVVADDRPRSLLSACGWGSWHRLIMDLQTGEGLIVSPGGDASVDLAKRRLWTCPLFPFALDWLYRQDLSDVSTLPDAVELPQAPVSLTGQRGAGPSMNDEAHRARHLMLHEMFDELLADYLAQRSLGDPKLEAPIRDLMVWSFRQTQQPTDARPWIRHVEGGRTGAEVGDDA